MNLKEVPPLGKAAACLAALLAASCKTPAPPPEQPPSQLAPTVTGSRIAYVRSVAGASPRFELVVAEADGGAPQVVDTSPDPIMTPSWSPDGQRIVFAGYDRGAAATFIEDLASRRLTRLTAEKGINGAPAWSPDGASIALTLSFGRNPDIYVVSLSSGARARITADPAIDTEPSWSPDGRSLAFISDRTGLPQIYTVRLSGGVPLMLNTPGKRAEQPRYSPDGKSMAMVISEGTRYRIGFSLAPGKRRLRVPGARGRWTAIAELPRRRRPAPVFLR